MVDFFIETIRANTSVTPPLKPSALSPRGGIKPTKLVPSYSTAPTDPNLKIPLLKKHMETNNTTLEKKTIKKSSATHLLTDIEISLYIDF